MNKTDLERLRNKILGMAYCPRCHHGGDIAIPNLDAVLEEVWRMAKLQWWNRNAKVGKEGGKMDKTICCYVGCEKEAEYIIWNGKEPGYDNKTESCTEHVGQLLEDSDKPNQVWPIGWGI